MIGIGVDIVSEAMEGKVEVGDGDGGSLEDWFCGEGCLLRRLIWECVIEDALWQVKDHSG